jgi:uncharacterized protein (DUF1697 family)
MPERFIALLRGINVVGRNKIPMAELRAHCSAGGWPDATTYIASGNIILSGTGPARKLEEDLEKLIQRRFGLQIPAIVRRAADWPAIIEANPFPKISSKAPSAVLIAFSKRPPHADAVDRLRERAAGGEKLEQAGNVIWVYYANGVGGSKLSPSLFDRFVGSPVTARNWNTVLKLGELSSS